MKKLLVLVVVIAAAYYGYQHYIKPRTSPDKTIVVYSLSYCQFCKNLSDELKQAKIEFTEYYVDKDSSKSEELTQKLRNSGVPGGNILMPVVDLGGVILANRPSLADIQRRLDK
jgi:glutaredoxin